MSNKAKVWGGSLTIVGAFATAIGAWLTTGQAPSMDVIIGVGAAVLAAAKLIYDTLKAKS